MSVYDDRVCLAWLGYFINHPASRFLATFVTTMHTTLHQRFDFLRAGIRSLRTMGSLAPSSRFLCRSIVAKIDPLRAHVVVELGAGDGVLTHYLLRRLGPRARLIVFEINLTFVEQIRREVNDPRLLVVHDSAENMGIYLHQNGISAVDYVVSGIPFVMLPEALTHTIIKNCRRWLRTDGWFIQFHYSPRLVGFYRRVFGNAEVDFVPLNFPPAIVISCKK